MFCVFVGKEQVEARIKRLTCAVLDHGVRLYHDSHAFAPHAAQRSSIRAAPRKTPSNTPSSPLSPSSCGVTHTVDDVSTVSATLARVRQWSWELQVSTELFQLKAESCSPIDLYSLAFH